MYAAHFGLQQEAFSIAPDPRFLHLSRGHREALAHLLYGLKGGGGFVLLTGEIGAGKTTVCRCFLQQIPAGHRVAYVFNPKLTPLELMQTVCQEFGLAIDPALHRTLKPYVDALNAMLLQVHAQGGQCLLVVDEAQALSPPLLEMLRLLTNLETSERKLLQIVLIGQPELRDQLARPELEQLSQRIIARVHLGPLSAQETAEYVLHRLQVAGLAGPCPFGARALARVHRITGGVPRRINLLCQHALLGAYARGAREVSPALVAQAAREIFGAREPQRRAWWPWTAGAAAALLGAAALGLWQVGAWRMGAGQLSAGPMGAPPMGAPPMGARPMDARPAGERLSRSAGPMSQGAAGSAAASGWAASAAAAQAPSGASAAVPAPGLAAVAAGSSAPPPARRVRAFAGRGQAWAAMASLWDRPPARSCNEAASRGLACHEGRADLALLRRLDRPAVLTLNEGGEVLLRGVGEQTAQVEGQDGVQTLPLASLQSDWSGAFATWWRPPPGWGTGRQRPAPEAAAWTLERLGALQGPLKGNAAGAAADEVLRTRVYAFQAAQALPLDGLAGPVTLMMLNRAGRIAEPRLQALEP